MHDDLDMEKTNEKNHSSKLLKKECKYCKCNSFMRVNCEFKDKQAKLIIEAKDATKLEDKVQSEK